uniref:Uncharacterized protein n=1 Tax=Anguilla anguilla TaxID=7936 RepID=A0A0E9W0J8_ANGAN
MIAAVQEEQRPCCLF